MVAAIEISDGLDKSAADPWIGRGSMNLKRNQMNGIRLNHGARLSKPPRAILFKSPFTEEI